jgi:hypothetical protein
MGEKFMEISDHLLADAYFCVIPVCPLYLTSDKEVNERNSYTCTGMYRLSVVKAVAAPRICRKSAHEVDKVVSPKHRLPLTPGEFPGTHFC